MGKNSQQTKEEPPRTGTELPSDYKLHPHDVICGRSKEAYNNHGNKKLREIVTAHVQEYIKSTTRNEKSVIIFVVAIQVSELGGKFVTRNGPSKWIEVSSKEAKNKVGHDFRNGVAKVHRQRAFLEKINNEQAAAGKSGENGDSSPRLRVPAPPSNTRAPSRPSTTGIHYGPARVPAPPLPLQIRAISGMSSRLYESGYLPASRRKQAPPGTQGRYDGRYLPIPQVPHPQNSTLTRHEKEYSNESQLQHTHTHTTNQSQSKQQK